MKKTIKNMIIVCSLVLTLMLITACARRAEVVPPSGASSASEVTEISQGLDENQDLNSLGSELDDSFNELDDINLG